MISEERLLDKIRGCLLRGAAGDALGYAVEFLSYKEIIGKYGSGGITFFDLVDGKARFSDDTQLTLFTVNGILNGVTKNAFDKNEDHLINEIFYAYQDWLLTQGVKRNIKNPKKKHTWLANIKDFYKVRSPGRTCLSSLALGDEDRIYNLNNPINDSKGSGAVMRIAPIGLVAHHLDDPFITAAEVGALTHGHPMSHLSCQLMTLIIANILKYDDHTLWRIIKDSVREVKERYDKEAPQGLEPFYEHVRPYVPSFIELMKRAFILARYDSTKSLKMNEQDVSVQSVTSLGKGWVAEEALAIALYAVCRYQFDPHKVIVCAVNHDGDSDTTGTLAGQIIGAYLGEMVLPPYVSELLELHSLIYELSDDLAKASIYTKRSKYIDKNTWEAKYLNQTYKK